MGIKYCTNCGKKMIIVGEYGKKKFDVDTGLPICYKVTVFKCPDFYDDVCNTYYSTHDIISIEELVDNIDGLQRT